MGLVRNFFLAQPPDGSIAEQETEALVLKTRLRLLSMRCCLSGLAAKAEQPVLR